MEFKSIRNELKKRFEKDLADLNNKILKEDGLNYVVRWSLNKKTSYKGTIEEQRLKCGNAIFKKLKKEFEKELISISSIENAPDFKGNFIITIEWKRSRMWGSNPTAYTNKGFNGSSIGGCGYCKHSTATAEGLNSDLSILKLLYKREEKRLIELEKSKMTQEDKDKFLCRRTFIGYGSGYNILPTFEGGVGWECHRRIVEGLGLKWDYNGVAKHTDIHIITK